MDKEEFRRLGHEIVDWISDYLEEGHAGPVFPATQPGDTLAKLPEAPPERGEPGERLFEDFKAIIVPGLTHWNDRRFFAYFPCNNSAPSVLGEMLAAGVGVNPFSWNTSPSATELEIRVMEWLGQMIGLPWKGCLQDTASTATLAALLAARERTGAVNSSGFASGRRLRVYASREAHSSLVKAVRIAGLGDENIVSIATRDDLSLDPDAFETAVERDLEAGHLPCFAMATIGTTSTTTIDPVVPMAALCRRKKIWLHVDGALAGTAAVLPEMRWIMDGVADADSFLFNPHKWMFTNFDCCAFFCREPLDLKRALAIQPEYLRFTQAPGAENFRDWSVQLGRRFRALKLWFVIRSFGVEGLRARVREHLEMAQRFAAKVEADPRFVLRNTPRLNTVCFSLRDEGATEPLFHRINATGEAYLSHTRIGDSFVVRVSFGQTQARLGDEQRLWQLIERLLEC